MKEYKLSEILTIKNGRDYKNLKNGLTPVFATTFISTTCVLNGRKVMTQILLRLEKMEI